MKPRTFAVTGRACLVVALIASCASACIERRDAASTLWTCDDEAEPPTWSLISAAVTQPSCGTASCHSALTQRAGVVLDSATAGYRSLVEAQPEPFVRPGSPQDSRLLYLLAGVEVARTMPPDAPLPAADVDLVRRWICAGAEND